MKLYDRNYTPNAYCDSPRNSTWIPDDCTHRRSGTWWVLHTMDRPALARSVFSGQYGLNYTSESLSGSSCVSVASIKHSVLVDAFHAAGQAALFRRSPGASASEDFLTAESLQPYVTVTPVAIAEMNGPEDTSPVKDWVPGSNLAFSKSPDIYNTPGDPTTPRLVFIDLVSSLSGAKTLGAAVLDGRKPYEVIQQLTIYHIEASWNRSRLAQNYLSESLLPDTPPGSDIGYQNMTICLRDGICLRPISISKEWAMYTNPFIPELNASVFTAAYPYYTEGRYTAICMRATLVTGHILANLIANGLSNIGLGFHQQTRLIPNHFIGTEPQEYVNVDSNGCHTDSETIDKRFNISFSYKFRGYSYNYVRAGVKVALSVLLIYASIATAFVFYTSIRGISSSAWDSIAELTALAVNSPPSSQLSNTCGGIESVNTYKSMARVVVIDNAKNGTRYGRHPRGQMQESGCGGPGVAKHAQLIFRDGRKRRSNGCEGEKQEESGGELVQPNERYGACPSDNESVVSMTTFDPISMPKRSKAVKGKGRWTRLPAV